MRLRSSVITRSCQRSVERAYERQFAVGPLCDARWRLPQLPMLVRCAVRVHDRREPRGALVFSMPVLGKRGPEERYVVFALRQARVLLFSPTGGLDAAGTLVGAPRVPVDVGQRWTHIDWATNLATRDWY